MMRSVVLDALLQRETREAIATCGERGVAEACNLSSQSLFRAAAGSPVSRGTAALIERGLERVRQGLAGEAPQRLLACEKRVGLSSPLDTNYVDANASGSHRVERGRSPTD